ncbi:uncharacterized protein PB18E9.04c-like [Phoenix dactylifera]|uniref:Uncharacterized protein PB18E9.04c-like n=1 Tax=Phoenix dactylifera TaxID=42345 RepID=A0A8B9AL94_PHODC|nr:uncharacterized protein PB18E9.04c-like [Phoenix dactylifera]
MGVRAIQGLIFLLGLLSCSGTLAKESEDGLSSSPASLRQTIKTEGAPLLQKPVVPKIEKKSRKLLLADTKLESSATMPQMDVVTPITTVPVINPSNPSTTTPTYNPVPTAPGSTTPTTTPVTNPYSTPTTTPVTNPYSTPTTTPVTNPYSTPTTSSPSSSGQSWCIASQTASETALQVALDYACGYGGADCSQIQSGGSCYNPNTVRDHASYAFNDYYQKNPTSTSCDFGGTAIITNTDPSTSTCHYASTSTSSSVLNTTTPTGSDVYGSVPPSPSGTTSMSTGTTLLFTLTCLIILPITLNVYK